jgi:hypothetical protein
MEYHDGFTPRQSREAALNACRRRLFGLKKESATVRSIEIKMLKPFPNRLQTEVDIMDDRLGHLDAIYYFRIPDMGQRSCDSYQCGRKFNEELLPNMPEPRGRSVIISR